MKIKGGRLSFSRASSNSSLGFPGAIEMSAREAEHALPSPTKSEKELFAMLDCVPDEEFNGKAQANDRALWLLPRTHPLRAVCITVMQNPRFDSVIILLILISSVLLAVDSPLSEPGTDVSNTLGMLDMVLTVAFSAEVAVKVVAMGFLLNGKGSYLRDGWCQLDFMTVLISVFSLTITSLPPNASSLKSLRTLRALRPLRLISRNPGMRAVISALINSIPNVWNVSVVLGLVFLVYAIVAVGLFKGKFNACQGDAFDGLSAAQQQLVVNPVLFSSLTDAQKCWAAVGLATNATAHAARCTVADVAAFAGTTSTPPTSKAVCLWLGCGWSLTSRATFDSLPKAMITLFAMSTTEGWVDLNGAMVAATGMDMQPVEGHAPYATIFSIVFLVTCAFFLLELFVGVIVDNFQKLKLNAKSFLLTDEQQQWLKVQRILVQMDEPTVRMRPRNPGLSQLCYDLSFEGARFQAGFDAVVMVCIALNSLVMASAYFGESDVHKLVAEVCTALQQPARSRVQPTG
jgi:voltage-dependent calcium channel L type alpha-1D